MRNIILFLVFAISVFGNFVLGQTVYSDPALPLADEPVTIYFNALGTPLESYTGTVYTHTGLYVNGGTDWEYVIESWGNNTTQPALTSEGNHLYSLQISPSIREYYGTETTDVIDNMNFVFRSANSPYIKTEDLFLDVYELGLNVSIISPDQNPYFVDPGESISVIADALGSETMYLYVDNVLINTVAGISINQNITASSEADSKHWIKVIAEAGSSQVTDSVYYYVRGEAVVEDLPAGVEDGINYIDDNTVTLVLLAPEKNSVYAQGDFNDWQIDTDYKLKRNTASANDPWARYWVTITGLTPGVEYAFQYIIDEELYLADPYTDKILDPFHDSWITEETYPDLKEYPQGKTTGIVSVLETGQEEYQWQVPNFEAPKNTDLVIYELLMRDFIDAHDFKTLTDTLSYLKDLGINAVELMPVSEFEGNDSWGYNPSFYFAVDKYYGPKNDFKEFIDVCHENGIAVIMDIVLNHAFGQNVMAQMYWNEDQNRPAANNPWFNEQSPNQSYHWGSDFNHETQYTKDFIDRVNTYWLEEYNIDGFRFDFTKGFTNTSGDGWAYDQPRINILKRMSDVIWESNPDAYVILEHFTDGNEEKNLANYGMMIWGNHNHNYMEAAMGWNAESNFSGISYLNRGYNDPHLVAYMESHDEERMMAKNLAYGNASDSYNIQELHTALKRIELVGVFFLTVPGPKMLWEFCELGYDYHINYPGDIGGDDNRLTPKPIKWDYYGDWNRRSIYYVYSYLNKIRVEEPAFETEDFTLSVSGAMKKIHLNHSSMNVTIVGNFDVETGDIDPAFQHDGWWYDYFAGDSIQVTDVNADIQLEAGEYHIYTDVKLDKPDFNLSVNESLQGSGSNLHIFPNPTSSSVNIEFELNEPTEISISIYDIYGKLVNNIFTGNLYKGMQDIEWNGNHIDGSEVVSGLYFCEVSINGSREVTKIMVN